MKWSIIFLSLLTPLLLPAQQYVVLKKPVTGKSSKIPAGARLMLIEQNGEHSVRYFNDTVRIGESDYQEISFPGDILKAKDSLFVVDPQFRKLTRVVVPNRIHKKPVVLYDEAGSVLFKFMNDTAHDINSDKKLRLAGEDIPDVFYPYLQPETVAKGSAAGSGATGTGTGADTSKKPETNSEAGIGGDRNDINFKSWEVILTIVVVAGIIVFLGIKYYRRRGREKNATSVSTASPKSNHRDEDILQERFYTAVSNMAVKLDKIEDKLSSLSSRGAEENMATIENLRADLIKKESDLEKLSFYPGRILRADQLQDSANRLYLFIELLESVYRQAVAFYDEQSGLGVEEKPVYYTAQFIAKYTSTVPCLSMGKWRQICTELKETGCILDPDLFRVFSQKGSASEEDRQLLIMACREFVDTYINASLILCEELKNLNRFTGLDDAISGKDAHSFERLRAEIVHHAEVNLRLKVNYLPLFGNPREYSRVKVVGDAPGLLYRNLNNLQRDQVIEIKSYGIYGIRDQETVETKVVTKK